MSASHITLRAYEHADLDAAIELWRRTWQEAYPDIDFAARLTWWRARWQDELVPTCTISSWLRRSFGAAAPARNW